MVLWEGKANKFANSADPQRATRTARSAALADEQDKLEVIRDDRTDLMLWSIVIISGLVATVYLTKQ